MEKYRKVFSLKEIKKLLKQSPTSVYKQDPKGFTPLMVASKLCDPGYLKKLLDFGYTNTPLEYEINPLNENCNSNPEIEDDKNDDVDDDNDDVNDDDDVNNDDDEEENEDDDDDDDDEYEWDIDDITNEFDRYCWEQEAKFYELYAQKFGRNIDFRDMDGLTAFQLCIQAKNVCIDNQIHCLQLLVKAGVDINLKDNGNQRPIEAALELNIDEKVLRCLCDLGCEVKLDEDLYTALRNLNLPLMKVLIEQKADVHSENYMGHNTLHFLLTNCEINYKNWKDYCRVLKSLVQDFKVNIDSYNNYSSVFGAAFFLFSKGTRFPLEFLMSENIDLMTCDKTQQGIRILDDRQRRAVRICTLEYTNLLFNYNMPYKLLLKFIVDEPGEEPDDETTKWLNSVYSSPPTLSKICKFSIRARLGKDIKTKVKKLEVPAIIQDVILLKDLLSSDCFD